MEEEAPAFDAREHFKVAGGATSDGATRVPSGSKAIATGTLEDLAI